MIPKDKWLAYRKWVESENKRISDDWLKSMQEEEDRRMKALTAEENKRTRANNKYEKDLKAYNALPFYRRYFVDPPVRPYMPYDYHPSTFIWNSIPYFHNITQEGFYDWLYIKESK